MLFIADTGITGALLALLKTMCTISSGGAACANWGA